MPRSSTLTDNAFALTALKNHHDFIFNEDYAKKLYEISTWAPLSLDKSHLVSTLAAKIGPGSTYTHRQAAEEVLAIIAARINNQLHGMPDVEQHTLDTITAKLLEGLPHCGLGIHQRCDAIVQSFTLPKNIGELLQSIREMLIINFSSKISADVHTNSNILRTAKKNGYGVRGPSDGMSSHTFDDNADSIRLLQKEFEQRYTAYHLPQLITSLLPQLLVPYYTGPKNGEESYKIEEATYCSDYLNDLLGPEFKLANYYDYFITNDDCYLVDIDWGRLNKLFFAKLKNEGYLKSLSSGRNILHAFYLEDEQPEFLVENGKVFYQRDLINMAFMLDQDKAIEWISNIVDKCTICQNDLNAKATLTEILHSKVWLDLPVEQKKKVANYQYHNGNPIWYEHFHHFDAKHLQNMIVLCETNDVEIGQLYWGTINQLLDSNQSISVNHSLGALLALDHFYLDRMLPLTSSPYGESVDIFFKLLMKKEGKFLPLLLHKIKLIRPNQNYREYLAALVDTGIRLDMTNSSLTCFNFLSATLLNSVPNSIDYQAIEMLFLSYTGEFVNNEQCFLAQKVIQNLYELSILNDNEIKKSISRTFYSKILMQIFMRDDGGHESSRSFLSSFNVIKFKEETKSKYERVNFNEYFQSIYHQLAKTCFKDHMINTILEHYFSSYEFSQWFVQLRKIDLPLPLINFIQHLPDDNTKIHMSENFNNWLIKIWRRFDCCVRQDPNDFEAIGKPLQTLLMLSNKVFWNNGNMKKYPIFTLMNIFDRDSCHLLSPSLVQSNDFKALFNDVFSFIEHEDFKHIFHQERNMLELYFIKVLLQYGPDAFQIGYLDQMARAIDNFNFSRQFPKLNSSISLALSKNHTAFIKALLNAVNRVEDRRWQEYYYIYIMDLVSQVNKHKEGCHAFLASILIELDNCELISRNYIRIFSFEPICAALNASPSRHSLTHSPIKNEKAIQAIGMEIINGVERNLHHGGAELDLTFQDHLISCLNALSRPSYRKSFCLRVEQLIFCWIRSLVFCDGYRSTKNAVAEIASLLNLIAKLKIHNNKLVIRFIQLICHENIPGFCISKLNEGQYHEVTRLLLIQFGSMKFIHIQHLFPDFLQAFYPCPFECHNLHKYEMLFACIKPLMLDMDFVQSNANLLSFLTCKAVLSDRDDFLLITLLTVHNMTDFAIRDLVLGEIWRGIIPITCCKHEDRKKLSPNVLSELFKATYTNRETQKAPRDLLLSVIQTHVPQLIDSASDLSSALRLLTKEQCRLVLGVCNDFLLELIDSSIEFTRALRFLAKDQCRELVQCIADNHLLKLIRCPHQFHDSLIGLGNEPVAKEVFNIIKNRLYVAKEACVQRLDILNNADNLLFYRLFMTSASAQDQQLVASINQLLVLDTAVPNNAIKLLQLFKSVFEHDSAQDILEPVKRCLAFRQGGNH